MLFFHFLADRHIQWVPQASPVGLSRLTVEASIFSSQSWRLTMDNLPACSLGVNRAFTLVTVKLLAIYDCSLNNALFILYRLSAA